MSRSPWMKWFPSDWRGDAKVRACSPLARYVWLEMLGLMHEAEPYGHLVSGGRAMDYATLSRLIAVDVGTVKRAVKELEAHSVFSRTDSGVIFSRRMLRDKNRSEKAKEIGARGGNPILINQGDKPGGDNPPHNGRDKPHIPDTRSQNIEYEKGSTGPPAHVHAREAFPEDGSIAFGPWAVRARRAGRNIDVDVLAQSFRAFCRVKDIPLDSPWIGRTFDTFVAKHRIQGVA